MTTAEIVHDVSVMNDLSFLWLEITAKCNLTCSHCYAESGPQVELYGNMTHGDWTSVLDEAAELGCRSVQFIGGEPTMHPRLHDLVDHANHRGFEFIEVYTNATRLGTKLLGCFQRSGVHVATSFYSDDPVVHEQITQGKELAAHGQRHRKRAGRRALDPRGRDRDRAERGAWTAPSSSSRRWVFTTSAWTVSGASDADNWFAWAARGNATTNSAASAGKESSA